MNILITGGAGYIGSSLVGYVLEAGHKVVVLDNFMYEENSLNHFCNNNNFTIVNGDVRDLKLVKSIISKVDMIIPLAALVGAPLCDKDPLNAKTINHDSIIDLLNLISKNQLIIMPTTNSAYGSGDKNNFCTEESPLKPISNYAKVKVEVEKALMERENSISYRLATVFGMSPRMRIDLLVNDFTYRAHSDRALILFEAHFKRNFIHVRDVCTAFIHAISNFDYMKNSIFNVGLSTANISKKELCDRIKLQIPNFIYIEQNHSKDQDQRNYIVSNEKIEKTGWKPLYDLDYGIKELIKGYQMLNNKKYSNV